jgi:hypothetical protein
MEGKYMLEQSKLKPIIDPLLNLLRSRKFLVAVFTLVIDVLVAYIPALEPARAELLVIFTLVGSILVGAIAYEDGKKNGS